MNGQLDFLSVLDSTPHDGVWLMDDEGEGIPNECGVYVDNVHSIREGALNRNHVEIKYCKHGDYIFYEFDYMLGVYGSGSPLCPPCHSCNRNVSPEFFAEQVYKSFVNTRLANDDNIKEKGEGSVLAKLCKKACERIKNELEAKNANA